MKVIWANQKIEPQGNSIFLVGPTPRSSNVASWRPSALELLANKFDGTVFVPEPLSGVFLYEEQIQWEYDALHLADKILAWVPRSSDMLGITTNFELGYWLATNPNKVYYGRPDGAMQTRYLDWFYEKTTQRQPCLTLFDLVDTCLSQP